MELEYLCVLWFNCFLININSCLTWTGIDMYWESLVCCVKCKRLVINISRFVCFTFHVTKKTIPWMRTNSSTLLFSGWMYALIQWLNETLLIMNKTQSTFFLCLDVLVLWWMIEEQEMIVSIWLKRNRWKWGKCENMLQNNTENKHSSLFFSNEIVCVNIFCSDSLLFCWFVLNEFRGRGGTNTCC